MINLNDTQRILLSTAAQREDGSLLPLPGSLADAGDRASKAIALLIKRGLAEEREAGAATAVHRADDDSRYGVFVTEAGCKAIGIEDAEEVAGEPTPPQAAAPDPAPAPSRSTKSAAVIALLGREQGATLAELIAATGWLPHTTRAALTGLRKKGHAVDRSKRDDETCYRITAA